MRFDADLGGRRVDITVREDGGRYEVTIGDRVLRVDACHAAKGFLHLLVDGNSHEAALAPTDGGFAVRLSGGPSMSVRLREAGRGPASRAAEAAGTGRLVAPMPGKVVRVLVAPGDAVPAGAGLVVVEAMKMENELRATHAGTVRTVHVREGQPVEGGAVLVEMD
jgi:biotin carboxyl carrier protein